jgi:hypothetical protein
VASFWAAGALPRAVYSERLKLAVGSDTEAEETVKLHRKAKTKSQLLI